MGAIDSIKGTMKEYAGPIVGGIMGITFANILDNTLDNPETYPIQNSNVQFKSEGFPYLLVKAESPSEHGEVYNETTGTAYNMAGDFRLSEDNMKEHYDLQSFTKDGETYSLGDTAVYGSVVKDSLQKYEERVNDFIDIAQQKKFGKSIESKLE